MPEDIIAYFDASHDVPEEVIMAAGFIPYKIMGDVNVGTAEADRYLFPTFCPAARSFLNEALLHSSEWKGIVVAHGCDATNRHFDVWKLHVKTPYLYWINVPMNLDTASGRRFFIRELKLFKESLENHFGTEITGDKLVEAIKLSNRVKSLLRKIGNMRSGKDISNEEYFGVLYRTLTRDKKDIVDFLEKKVEEFSSRGPFPENMKKILLTGSEITYGEFWRALEESGLRVVRDDLSIGERYYAVSIPEEGDPLECIVDYHISKPRASTKHPPDKRAEYLLRAAREGGVDGVVYQTLKFCEPYAYDSVFIVNILKSAGFRVLNIERDFTPEIDGRTRSRLEAFAETV